MRLNYFHIFNVLLINLLKRIYPKVWHMVEVMIYVSCPEHSFNREIHNETDGSGYGMTPNSRQAITRNHGGQLYEKIFY